MKVLVACEFSGIVRDAFIERGHDAISCDLLPTERPGPHIRGDVRELLRESWDLVIAHPPCSYLSNYNTPFKKHEQIPDWWERVADGIAFFLQCRAANAPRVAVENPLPMPAVREIIGGPDDWVEPYWFGDVYRKRTGLWLKGLPPLMRTLSRPNGIPWVRDRPSQRVIASTPAWEKRTAPSLNTHTSAAFWPGIAAAMAQQWG